MTISSRQNRGRLEGSRLSMMALSLREFLYESANCSAPYRQVRTCLSKGCEIWLTSSISRSLVVAVDPGPRSLAQRATSQSSLDVNGKYGLSDLAATLSDSSYACWDVSLGDGVLRARGLSALPGNGTQNVFCCVLIFIPILAAF